MGKLFVLALIIMVVLAACAAPKASPQQIAPDSGASQTVSEKSTAPTAGWEQEWDKVLAAARREGTISVMSDGGASLRDAIIGGFKSKYGINMDIIAGKGAQLAEKIITEQRNGLYLWDVQHGGATTKLTQLKPSGAYQSLDQTLIRKDVLDPKFWAPGQPSWVDKDHTILNIEYSVSGKLGINTNIVKPGELKSLKDLLQPKWKGKIIINDPTVAGTGSKFFGVVATLHGYDIWREIAKQEPVIMRDEKLMVTWLAMGKYPVIISPKTEPMFDARAAGAPVEDIGVAEALYATGDTISFVKNAPHPNAAKVYINWILSQEGQKIYHAAQGSWSGRNDVVLDSTPAKKPEPGVTYFNSNGEEFLKNQPEHMKMALEIFGHLMK